MAFHQIHCTGRTEVLDRREHRRERVVPRILASRKLLRDPNNRPKPPALKHSRTNQTDHLQTLSLPIPSTTRQLHF